MRQWLHFFLHFVFGTPRRFLFFLSLIGVLLILVFPGILAVIVGRLMESLALAVLRVLNVFSPLVEPALMILFMIIGFMVVWRVFRRR